MKDPRSLIQLPNGVQAVGYKQTGPFKYEQVFHCPTLNFTGTEAEFLEAGHAYEYFQIDNYRRFVMH